MTPEQQERLEYLKNKKDKPVQESSEVPIHNKHCHTGGKNGIDTCACTKDCIRCNRF